MPSLIPMYNTIHLKAKRYPYAILCCQISLFRFIDFNLLHTLVSSLNAFFTTQELKNQHQSEIRLGSQIVNCSQIVLNRFSHSQNLNMYLGIFFHFKYQPSYHLESKHQSNKESQ